jgi:hypothetical protein
MHLKVFLIETEKPKKFSLLGKKTQKTQKKTKKPKKKKKTHWAGFKKKTGFFPTLRGGGGTWRVPAGPARLALSALCAATS